MRVVLDTNLLVRAAITPAGLAREILRFIEADAGAANILCTFDVHFYSAPVLEFCAIHGIRVVNDVQFIHLLRAE